MHFLDLFNELIENGTGKDGEKWTNDHLSTVLGVTSRTILNYRKPFGKDKENSSIPAHLRINPNIPIEKLALLFYPNDIHVKERTAFIELYIQSKKERLSHRESSPFYQMEQIDKEVSAQIDAYLSNIDGSRRYVTSNESFGEDVRVVRLQANAVRIWGADQQAVDESRVSTEYNHASFKLAFDDFVRVQTLYQKVVGEAETDEKSRHQMLLPPRYDFDGPVARLISYTASPVEGRDANSETPSIHLRFGQLQWSSYEWLNARTRLIDVKTLVDEGILDIEEFMVHGSTEGIHLSNVIDTATTIVTSDGYFTYCQRAKRRNLSVPGAFTSAVAENISRYKDNPEFTGLTPPKDPRQVELAKNYTPFDTVRRGVTEEISALLKKGNMSGIDVRVVLTGISFDLLSKHPDLLFVATVNCKLEELTGKMDTGPGADFNERWKFLSGSFFDKDRVAKLKYGSISEPQTRVWIPAGLSSIIRALEIFTPTDGNTITNKEFFKRTFNRIRGAADR